METAALRPAGISSFGMSSGGGGGGGAPFSSAAPVCFAGPRPVVMVTAPWMLESGNHQGQTQRRVVDLLVLPHRYKVLKVQRRGLWAAVRLICLPSVQQSPRLGQCSAIVLRAGEGAASAFFVARGTPGCLAHRPPPEHGPRAAATGGRPACWAPPLARAPLREKWALRLASHSLPTRNMF